MKIMSKNNATNNVDETKPVQLSLLKETEENFSQTPTTEEQEKQMHENEQAVKKQKGKKKWTNLIFFILNLVVVGIILAFQLINENVVAIDITQIKIEYVFILIITLALLIFVNSEQIRILIKQNTGRSRPALSFQTYAIGRYYDNITPLASGGQPFQIFYLTQRGLNASTALSVPLSKYVIWEWGWLIYAIINIFLVFKYSLFTNVSLIETASFIGFGLNTCLLGVIMVLSVSKKIGQTLTVKILKFLEKIKIIKNYEKQYTKVMKTVSDFQNTMRGLTTKIGQFFYMFFLSFISNFLNYLLAFWIYCMFFGFNLSVLMPIVVLTFMVDMASSFVPLPGGSGMNELSFTAILAPFFGPTIFWAMLIWRVVSYYYFIIQGLFMLGYNYAVGNKKYYWMKRKWELQAESDIFKAEKLRNYKQKAKAILNNNKKSK